MCNVQCERTFHGVLSRRLSRTLADGRTMGPRGPLWRERRVKMRSILGLNTPGLGELGRWIKESQIKAGGSSSGPLDDWSTS